MHLSTYTARFIDLKKERLLKDLQSMIYSDCIGIHSGNENYVKLRVFDYFIGDATKVRFRSTT